MLLDETFGVAAVAIDFVVQVLCAGLLKRGYNVADVNIAAGVDHDPADYAARLGPGTGCIVSGCEHPAWRTKAAIFEFGLLDGKIKLTVQCFILTKSDDEFDAIGTAIGQSGKDFKLVASHLFPDMRPESAYARLKACISPTGDQRLKVERNESPSSDGSSQTEALASYKVRGLRRLR